MGCHCVTCNSALSFSFVAFAPCREQNGMRERKKKREPAAAALPASPR